MYLLFLHYFLKTLSPDVLTSPNERNQSSREQHYQQSTENRAPIPRQYFPQPPPSSLCNFAPPGSVRERRECLSRDKFLPPPSYANSIVARRLCILSPSPPFHAPTQQTPRARSQLIDIRRGEVANGKEKFIGAFRKLGAIEHDSLALLERLFGGLD